MGASTGRQRPPSDSHYRITRSTYKWLVKFNIPSYLSECKLENYFENQFL